jgi:hypothetical protein
MKVSLQNAIAMFIEAYVDAQLTCEENPILAALKTTVAYVEEHGEGKTEDA